MLVLALLCALAAPVCAGEFKRGVNLNQWLDTYATGPVSAQELGALRAAGFDHVRLPIDPVKLGWAPENGASLKHVARLHAALEAIRASGLDVIVDMHPDAETQQVIEDDPVGADALVALWLWLAKQLRPTSPDHVALELLNEPQYQGVGGDLRWSRYQKRLLRIVRGVLPLHPVVVTGRQTGTLDGLIELTPLDAPNLIYSFHFYAPSIFTHQGAVWMRNVPWTTAGHWSDILYPAKQARLREPFMDAYGDQLQGQQEMQQYLSDDWSQARITQNWGPLLAWARRYPDLRIRLGEFGVYRKDVEPASRYQWISDVRQMAEANGWGWSLWNYGSDFGITGQSNIQGAPRGPLEPAAMAALGLPRPAK